MNPDDTRTRFGDALERRRRELALPQRAVAERINELVGTRYADVSIGQWAKGEHIPEPHIVFALETALGLGPGDLSHHLGYVPTGALSVLAAIGSDSTLTPRDRRALEVLYLTLSSDE